MAYRHLSWRAQKPCSSTVGCVSGCAWVASLLRRERGGWGFFVNAHSLCMTPHLRPLPCEGRGWQGARSTCTTWRDLRFVCSRADSRQVAAELFDITEGNHLLDFLAEEKIKGPTRHDSELLSQA